MTAPRPNEGASAAETSYTLSQWISANKVDIISSFLDKLLDIMAERTLNV